MTLSIRQSAGLAILFVATSVFTMAGHASPGMRASGAEGILVDLSITKTDAPDPVTAGTNVTYTITVLNPNVSTAADSGQMSDTLPPGTTFVSLSAPGGWTTTTPAVGGTGTVTATLPTVPPSMTAVFTLVVNVSSSVLGGSLIFNTATITSNTPDPNLANNVSTAQTTVAASSDVSVTKSDSPDPVTAGANLTYTVTLTNGGPSDAAGVSVTDALPPGTTFVSLTSPGGWTLTTPAVGGTGTVTATNPSVASGSTHVFTLVVNVGAGVLAGTIIANTVVVSSTSSDPSPGNNTATSSTTVAAAVPTVTVWFLLVLAASVLGGGVWLMRRRSYVLQS